MEKELGILLLIFVAVVGLSNAVSAAPISGPVKGHNAGYGMYHSGVYIKTITLNDSLLPGVKATYLVQINKQYLHHRLILN